MDNQDFRQNVATFRDAREFAEKVRYFLYDHGAREAMRSRLQTHILEKETYGQRFYDLLEYMDNSH